MQTKAGSDFAFEVPESKSVSHLSPTPLREVPVPSLRALEIQSNQGLGEGEEAGWPHPAGSSAREGWT